MGKNKAKFDFDASNIIAYVFGKIKILIGISAFAAIITAVITLTMPNMFKSEVVMFPVSKLSEARWAVDDNYSPGKDNLSSVGEDEDVDQLMQVLASSEIRSKLISKYKLAEHYKIDVTKKNAGTRIYKRLNGNIKCSRTAYNSVVISVWDENPEYASKMANDISSMVDSVFKKMQFERVSGVYKAVKLEHDSLKKEIDFLVDSAVRYSKEGVLDFSYQTQELTKAYYNALMAGKTDVANNAKNKLSVIERLGYKTNVLRDRIVYEQRQLAEMAKKLTIAKVDLNMDVPRKFVVENASPSEEKDKPKRSFIVFFAALSSFFAALFAFIIFDNIKKLFN